MQHTSAYKKIYMKALNILFVNFLKFYNKHKDLLFLIIISVILDLYILRNSLAIGLVQSADWPIPILNLKYLYYYSIPAWNFQDMSSNGFNIYLLTYGFFSSVLHNPAIVQKLFYYVPWASSPLFSYLLLRYFGLKNKNLVFFSLLYQFGPWITGEFMDGEPTFVILYLFLPLVLFILLYFNKNLIKLYLYSTIAMMIPSFFTLEAPFFYILVVVPFLLYISVNSGIKRAAKTALILAFSYVTIIFFNIYSISPYIDGFNGISSNSGALLGSFVNFAPAVVAKYWLLIFLFGITILTLTLVITKNNLRSFFIFFTIVSIFLVFIYPGLISNSISIYILTNIPLLAPFINPSDFILYLWFELFVISAYTSTQIINKHIHIEKYKIKQLYKYTHKSLLIGVSIAIVILLISSATIEIQSYGSHDTDIYLFSDGTHFDKTEVSPQYMALENYLKDHGASFNLSEHTIILPENPNSTLPFYIGQQMIPGYEGLFGKNVSNAIINGINSENSSFLMLLSLLGIRYLAVIDIPASSWSGTNGSPQLSMWGDKYIFIGNYTIYVHRLENISKLSEVYSKNGLWIFENKYYISPILESKYNLIKYLFSQNYGKFYTETNMAINFSKYFTPVKYKITGLTTITLYNTTKNETIVIDQEWGPDWFIKNSPRETISDNNFKLLAFNNSLGGKFTLVYGFQKTYDYMIVISIISNIGFLISISYYEIRIRHNNL